MDIKPDWAASDQSRRFLRHCVATLAYRSGKARRGVPEGFADFRLPLDARTPSEILAHMVDLLDWALSLARGAEQWVGSKPRSGDQDVDRFFRALGAFDAYLASAAPLHAPAERLFQGPIATRRRLAGAPLRGENYFRADIVVGRVSATEGRNTEGHGVLPCLQGH